MTNDTEAEGYARECVRLAHLTPDPLIREQLFQMARDWMHLAMQDIKAPAPRGPYAGARLERGAK
jgi:Mn-containing catalase